MKGTAISLSIPASRKIKSARFIKPASAAARGKSLRRTPAKHIDNTRFQHINTDYQSPLYRRDLCRSLRRPRCLAERQAMSCPAENPRRKACVEHIGLCLFYKRLTSTTECKSCSSTSAKIMKVSAPIRVRSLP